MSEKYHTSVILGPPTKRVLCRELSLTKVELKLIVQWAESERTMWGAVRETDDERVEHEALLSRIATAIKVFP
jgi:hypothetical protein